MSLSDCSASCRHHSRALSIVHKTFVGSQYHSRLILEQAGPCKDET
jgi:hypothetical protein